MGILDRIANQNKFDSYGTKQIYTKTENEIKEFYVKELVSFGQRKVLQSTRFTFTKNGWKKKSLLYFPDNLIERRISFENYKKVLRLSL